MGGTYEQFKTDLRLEQEGITLDLGEAGKFLLARAGGSNKKFAKKFKDVSRPHRRAIQNQSIDDETANQIMVESYADAVLMGWSGVTGSDGQPLEFNRANAIKLLTDLPWLFEEIRRAAEDAALYRLEVREEDGKN